VVFVGGSSETLFSKQQEKEELALCVLAQSDSLASSNDIFLNCPLLGGD